MVLVGLVLAELGLRRYQEILSGDIAHLNDADSIAATLAASDGLRVLMFGNSLLYRGVDPIYLESLVEAESGLDISVAMVFPDGTTPMEWSYLYRKIVFNPQRLPDVMVMAFGPGHLRDRSPESQVLRLAAHHVDSRDIGSLFERDIRDFERRSQFALARISMAFALRDRLAPRVFDLIIPDYRTLAPILLQAPTGTTPVRSAGPTFVFLERLLDDAMHAGVPLMALPMPAPEAYELEPEARVALERHGDTILEMPADLGLEPERFYDGQHLDPIGRTRFTERLAPVLAAALLELKR